MLSHTEVLVARVMSGGWGVDSQTEQTRRVDGRSRKDKVSLLQRLAKRRRSSLEGSEEEQKRAGLKTGALAGDPAAPIPLSRP
jgi:hypothetical protein